jgi:hypothetical protein
VRKMGRLERVTSRRTPGLHWQSHLVFAPTFASPADSPPVLAAVQERGGQCVWRPERPRGPLRQAAAAHAAGDCVAGHHPPPGVGVLRAHPGGPGPHGPHQGAHHRARGHALQVGATQWRSPDINRSYHSETKTRCSLQTKVAVIGCGEGDHTRAEVVAID